MTAPPSIDLSGWLSEQLGQASPDLLRQMIGTFVQALMGAEADAVCGAEYGARSADRTNTRNGYRRREWDTRTGTIDVAIPKLRTGSYFPDWLLERRRRAEAALVSVVATSYLLGVSTRRMEKLVETLGITRLSKSQVSAMAKDLDAQVEAFRTRPLDAGPYTFVAADALVLKVREGGRTVNVHALLAVGVNAEGYREIRPRFAGGTPRPARDQRRGRRRLVGVLPRPGRAWPVRGGAGHQRRARRPGGRDRRDAARRRLAEMSYALRGESDGGDPEVRVGLVKALLHSVYNQPDADAVHAQFDRVLDTLTDKLPAVTNHLDAARTDILAFTSFPKASSLADLRRIFGDSGRVHKNTPLPDGSQPDGATRRSFPSPPPTVIRAGRGPTPNNRCAPRGVRWRVVVRTLVRGEKVAGCRFLRASSGRRPPGSRWFTGRIGGDSWYRSAAR